MTHYALRYDVTFRIAYDVIFCIAYDVTFHRIDRITLYTVDYTLDLDINCHAQKFNKVKT